MVEVAKFLRSDGAASVTYFEKIAGIVVKSSCGVVGRLKLVLIV